VVVAHAVAGFAIVVLAPWKSVIVRRGLARRRRGAGASLALLWVVLVGLGAGVLHATGIARFLGPLSAMQLHVGAALLAMPLALAHVLARPVAVRAADLSRRQVLRALALLGASGAAYLAVEGVVRLGSLPGARRRFTGSYERGSHDPESMPVTQWLDDRVPSIERASWRLRVRGPGVDRVLTYADVTSFSDRRRAVLDCTGGWWAEQEWEGVRLSTLLQGIEGRSILVSSVTGYRRRLPAADAGRLLLATRVGGAPLSPGHGAPLRLVAPGRRGFWWVKWIDTIHVDDTNWWLQGPFPVT
jgi:DMSO/TMAO reductase YedYZ molybdopterin-dependent catalytic subunit